MKTRVFGSRLVQDSVWILTDSVVKKIIMGLLPDFYLVSTPPSGYGVYVSVTLEFRVVQEDLGPHLQARDATFTPVNL
jgi:hypothetical protein